MSLHKWQKKFLELENNDNEIITAETSTGKSYVGVKWLDQKDRLRMAVIVCPKQIRERWKREVPAAHVYSFQDFVKAEELPENPSAIIVDEADEMASPLFLAKMRSQRSEKLYHYVMQNPGMNVLLLTATPVRSTPWNMHTLLTLSRRYIDWKKYRERYFKLEYKPYLPRPAWLPKKGWRKAMQQLIDKYTHVALISDLVDEMPPETHEVVKLPPPDYDEVTEWEPARKFSEDHRLEQLSKPKEILNLAKGYRKVAVVAYYTEQIDALEKALSKDRPVYVLDGRTKKPDEVITAAEEDPECFFIIQASVAAGFEIPSYTCMIFASQSFGVRNYVQMKGRIRRSNALKPVVYYYLLGGRADKMVYDNIQAGRDFVPSEYMQKKK